MTISVASLFTARWEVFWAATYSFELELFDEYLFRRLGEPPLNATLLVDFANLARLYEGISAEETWRVQRVNHDYLLRAMGSAQGRFHPKTYFFASEKEGSLLVGSGNLRLRGIDEGYEVFCRFDSADPAGLAAIRSWRNWMHRLVEDVEDEELRHRWFRLQRTAGEWLTGGGGPSQFITNADQSFADQLLSGFSQGIDELHVTAPFYDRDAQALAELMARAKPAKVSIYLGRDTSVDGGALRAVLKASKAKVRAYRYEPARFVHAKLVAITKGGKARLLSGSPNMSRAAFESVVGQQAWANVEAAILLDASRQRVVSAFNARDLELVEVDLDDLPDLEYEEPPPALVPPIRLQAARQEGDGAIKVTVLGNLAAKASLTTGNHTVALDGIRTSGPVPVPDRGCLVWLVDAKGNELSNRVALDDVTALRRQLEPRAAGAGEKPRELDAADLDTPIGKVLHRLNRDFILDLEETKALREANSYAGRLARATSAGRRSSDVPEDVGSVSSVCRRPPPPRTLRPDRHYRVACRS